MTGRVHDDDALLLWCRLTVAQTNEVLQALADRGGPTAEEALAVIARAAAYAPVVPAEPPTEQCPAVARELRVVR